MWDPVIPRTLLQRPQGAVATLIVLALSSWVSLAGVLENASHSALCSQNNYQVEFVCWYVPDFSSPGCRYCTIRR